MKDFLFFVLFLVCSTACSTALVYKGQATYYLPNGDSETFDATYTESYTNGTKDSGYLSVDVGAGNIYIIHGIPYTFKGHLTNVRNGSISTVSGNADILLNPQEKDGFFECTYNGVSHTIPAKVFYELRYKSNGDSKKLNKLLIEYLNK